MARQIKDFFAEAAAHFYRFDVNENGIMNVSRLQSYCQDNNLPLSDSQINNVMQNLDLKGNGRIDFHEFMTYILFMKYDIGKYTTTSHYRVSLKKEFFFGLKFLPLYYILNEEILSRKNSNIKHILNFPAGFLKFPLFSTCEQENTAELMHVYIPSAISKIFLAVYYLLFR